MGWTHHWQRRTELPQGAFAAAVDDCKLTLPRAGISLAGFEGNGQPILQADAIVFNGVGGACCEPFEIQQTQFDRRGREVVCSFCKTEHLPYDLCVQVALVILKHHLGESIKVGSDGKDDDWAEARRICQETLGYGEDFRLEPKATE